NVGSGSYTTQFPGVDAAARNGFPPGQPQVSGAAATRPIPTNDWWSALLNKNHADNLFNYPLAMRTHENGLIVSYIIPSSGPKEYRQPIGDHIPVTIGVDNLNAARATVSDYSDWTVAMDWQSGSNNFNVTAG